MILRRLILILALTLSALLPAIAQELKATVEVNTDMIQGTNKDVFDALRQGINDYFNNTRFSQAQLANNERIECRIILTVGEYADDHIKGELNVQSSRPVYNSTYTSTLLNIKDSRVEFDYRIGEPIVFNEMEPESNLTAILDFYAYLIMAVDFDSFSPRGGDPFYERLKAIVQRQQSSGETGWKTFEDNRNRAALLQAFTDVATSPLRDLYYTYHRRGLDEMVTSPDKGREAITTAVSEIIPAIHEADPMGYGPVIFRDAKLDELVNIYSKAGQSEREGVAKILLDIYPTDRSRIDEIKNPPDPNAR